MSLNPFTADPKLAARHAELSVAVGADMKAELLGRLAPGTPLTNIGWA